MDKRMRRALEAVAAGQVKHAHPFTWACEVDALDVLPRTLQRAAKMRLIRVQANAPGHWRPVTLTDAGVAALHAEASASQGDR